MTNELFSSKFNNFIFLVLLFFPLLHFFEVGILFIKPVFFLTIGIVGLVFFRKGQLPFSTISINFTILAFVLFLFLQVYFHWEIDIMAYVFLLALFIFYKIGLSFLSANENSNVLIIRIYMIMTGTEIVLFALSKKLVFLNFYPNESIFSILMAAQLLFVTPSLKKYSESFVKSKKSQKAFLICYLFLCYCLLFCTKGRSGILGFTIALGVLNYNYLKSKVGVLKGLIIASCLLLLLLNFKSNSSSGRLLIYKVIVTQMEPRELITGIGYGKFKVKYNQLQANYFSKKSIDGNEALLASNNYYMFNDPLQLIIETGLIGLVVLSFLTIKFFVLFKRNSIFFEQKPILAGAYLSIISVIVSSLFSYPLQITGILMQFFFYIAIIANENKEMNQIGKLLIFKNTNEIINRGTLLLCAGYLVFFGLVSFGFYMKSKKAILYSNMGFRKKAIEIYCGLNNEFIKDGDVLHNYSEELYKANKIDSALIILEKASNYQNNDKTAILMGNLFQEKQLFPEAEKQYKKAIFNNPKLFANRASLFKFYYETKQFKKAIYWGNSILRMPVKIPSMTVTNIKNETRKLMLEIEKSQRADEFTNIYKNKKFLKILNKIKIQNH